MLCAKLSRSRAPLSCHPHRFLLPECATQSRARCGVRLLTTKALVRSTSLRFRETSPTALRSRHHAAADKADFTRDETIFALSTAPGRAAIAIVRCSGPACLQIYESLCPNAPAPKPRRATLRRLFTPTDPTLVLDPRALVLYFPGPNTVTGEDILELHLHGGRATVRATLSAISSTSSAACPIRPAEAGEFTQRAFYNGQLDLTEVEALSDTLAAETETQRALAARGAGGGGVLRARYEDWREQLLQARGELEALIDFSEDQHFDESPVQLTQGVAGKVRFLLTQIDASIKNAARGELLRNGIKVALLGAPNVGKSSLLNKIVGREAAIVSSTAGTTRDVVETNIDINGFFCNFGDLAGIRGSAKHSVDGGEHVSDIEMEGIRRAKARALDADVVLVIRAVDRHSDGSVSVGYSPEVEDAVKELDHDRQQVIHVVNKADLLGSVSSKPNVREEWRHWMTREHAIDSGHAVGGHGIEDPGKICMVTCKPENGLNTSDGIQELLHQLTDSFRALTDALDVPGIPQSDNSGYEESLGASERQARLLSDCRDRLEEFLATVDVPSTDVEEDIDIVVAAESLREAARCLARTTGRGEGGDVEDVLGVVFEKFCVGK